MTGFLPILTASNGTAPSAAADTATSQTGTEGAFGAVLAGLMGSADADAAPDQQPMFADAAPGFTAGSALQRLKLAMADAGTLPGRPVVHTALASRVTMLDMAPATLELVSAETDAATAAAAEAVSADAGKADVGKAAGETPRIARPAMANVPEAAAEEAPEAAATDAAALAALAAPQPQPAAAPVVRPEISFGTAPEMTGGEAEADMPPAAILAVEPAAGGVEPNARDVETARHDLSAMATTRPLTATTTALPTQPAQAWTNPNAGEDAGEGTTVAAARQGADRAAPEAVAEAAVKSAAVAVAAEPATAPAIGQVASAVREMTGEPRRNGTAFAANANAPVDAATGLTAVAPEQAAAPAQSAKPAASDIKTAAGDLPMIEPAAGNAPEAADEPRRMDAAADGDAEKSARLARNGEQQTTQASATQASASQASSQASSQPGAPAAQSAALPEGFQPVQNQIFAAQPLHSQTQAQPGLPNGADVVRVATPQQLPEAVGIAISRHVDAEATEFTLRLDPAELGRIEVKLEMGKDGQASVSIQADNASTFDLLRRDSSALERALAEAGLKLDSGGLNFSLRQQDGQNQQQFAGEGAQRQATGRMQEASLAGLEQDNTPRPSRRSGAPGLLDLSI